MSHLKSGLTQIGRECGSLKACAGVFRYKIVCILQYLLGMHSRIYIPCGKDRIRIIFQIQRLCGFKSCGEPCWIYSAIEFLNMFKEGLYPKVRYAGVLQKIGKKILRIRIC